IFFFHHTPTTEIYTLSLHDALPICKRLAWQQRKAESFTVTPLHCGSSQLGYRPSDKYGHGISLGTAMTLSGAAASPNMGYYSSRSEEHTSELQSRGHLVCRLLLEKK